MRLVEKQPALYQRSVFFNVVSRSPHNDTWAASWGQPLMRWGGLFYCMPPACSLNESGFHSALRVERFKDKFYSPWRSEISCNAIRPGRGNDASPKYVNRLRKWWAWNLFISRFKHSRGVTARINISKMPACYCSTADHHCFDAEDHLNHLAFWATSDCTRLLPSFVNHGQPSKRIQVTNWHPQVNQLVRNSVKGVATAKLFLLIQVLPD